MLLTRGSCSRELASLARSLQTSLNMAGRTLGLAVTSLVLSAVIITVQSLNATMMAHEIALLENITHRDFYHKEIRPASGDGPVVVNFGLAIINIVEVNDVKGYISAKYWLRYLWRDERLQFNPDDYGGINVIRVPIERLWRPDIKLYNSATAEASITEGVDVLAVVYSSGEVLFIPATILSSTCSFDMYWFPYDSHTCTLKFGSWAFNGNQVDLEFYESQESLDTTDYIDYGEWELLETKGKKTVKRYPCCSEPYPDLSFTVTLDRKTTFFSQMYVAPGVVLALVMPFIFTLPLNRPHRYVLGASLMISVAVMMSSFDQSVPNTNGSPMIGRWYTALMILLSFAMILSAMVSNFAQRSANGQHPPAALKKVFVDVLGRLLCIERGVDYHGKSEETDDLETKSDHTEWLLVARALDRLFFVLYCVLFIIMLIITAIK